MLRFGDFGNLKIFKGTSEILFVPNFEKGGVARPVGLVSVKKEIIYRFDNFQFFERLRLQNGLQLVGGRLLGSVAEKLRAPAQLLRLFGTRVQVGILEVGFLRRVPALEGRAFGLLFFLFFLKFE